MKKHFILLIFSFSIIYAQIIIPFGTTVNIDGFISQNEWDDAKEFDFSKNEFLTASVKIKHDSKNLYLLYLMDNFKDKILSFPEIFIDPENNGGTKWDYDDHWFHVSAQDCYALGKRDYYKDCIVEAKNWTAVPNYPFGDNFKFINAIEIVIPFRFAGLTQNKEFGICFSLSVNPGDVRLNIPETATEDIPSGWGKFIIKDIKK